jgi:hypothetical protein
LITPGIPGLCNIFSLNYTTFWAIPDRCCGREVYVNRTGWLSAILLVAVGATHQAVGPGTATVAKQQAQSGSVPRPTQSETTNLCGALRARVSLPPPDPNRRQSGACLPAGHNILFIIATVPNPANSQLALSFDRTIESIERAAGDRGFLFDRFVFPWDAEPHRQPDPEKNRVEEKRRRDSEAKPGMLLFRGHFDESDPMHQFESLAIMLVPENPSSGVNGDAFEAAATFAKENSTSRSSLAILGPSFSSSAQSLHNAMHRTSLRYVVRSGSATVPEAWNLLNADTHSFEATVRDDDQASEALFKHLGATGEWQKQGRVAILSESGTLYGAHASSSRQSSDRLNLVFPRGISWLRNAYQDLPAVATPSLPPGIVSPIAQLLPFAIAEPTYGDDKAPSLSAAQTPISQESALLSIANTLRRERVRFVVITSTDPLDNIFLIRFLRTHCPDLRVITFESDLLYIRAATDFPATGVVLVTTYPLFLQSQAWSSYDASENRVPFVSMASEGTYNALRSILMHAAGGAPWDNDDWPLDYRTPFESDTRKPAVWLTVVTTSGYWPLAVLGDHDLEKSIASPLLYAWPRDGKQNESEETLRAPTIEGVSRLWYLLAFGLMGICILPLLAVQGRMNGSNVPLLATFSYRPQDENALGRVFFRAVVLLSLAMICWLLAWPPVVLWSNGPNWKALTVAGILVAMGFALVLAAAYEVAHGRSSSAAQKRPYWYMLIAAIGLVLFWIENWRRTFYGGLHHEGFFAAYRSLDLVNGVAPTIPFVLIVLALISWAWVHLKRLYLFAESPHSVPSLGTQFLAEARAAALVEQINLVNDAVQNPFSLPGFAYLTGVSIVAALYFVMGEYTQSLELRSFDVLYGVAFAVVVLLLVLTCTRMVLIWTRLRSALKTIELHPIRETFGTVWLMENWGPILHRGIDPDHLEGRYRELLGRIGNATVPAMSDADLENMRKEALDPAWARQDVDGVSFKATAELFALRYIAFIQATCRQIENLLIFLLVGFLLTLISLNSYPFQSSHVLGWFMAILLIAIGLAVGFVLASSERDPVLSRLNRTTPGKIGKDFYLNLLSYGALPVLTVLAAQFPTIGSFLFSWVQPVLQTMRG